MVATNVGINSAGLTAGVAAQSIELTAVGRRCQVVNVDADAYLSVRYALGTFAASPAPAAVLDADETIAVPPNSTRTIWEASSNRALPKLINLSVIASAASTKMQAEMSEFVD